MKRLFFILTIFVSVVAFGTMAFATTKANTGCGLGTTIWEGSDALLFQLCASSTNGISGNQTFGITSGTLGCEDFKGIVSNEKIQLFIANNMDSLANDISEGNGEYLNTLAVLMEVKEENRTEFYGKMQSNFSNIFTSNNVTSTQVAGNIDAIMN